MALRTKAYKNFEISIMEVNILLDMANKYEQESPFLKTHEINSLSRGAIVLLSSHLEAYIKSLGELTVERMAERQICLSKMPDLFRYHAEKEKIESIKQTADGSKIGRKLRELYDSDFVCWTENGVISDGFSMEKFNKGFSNPKFEKICKYFDRFGYGNFKQEFDRKLTSEARAITTGIDQIVSIRNKIAHGDSGEQVTPVQGASLKDLACKFVSNTDQLFASFATRKICPIR